MLEKLVPMLDLCRQLEANEFQESELAWVFDPCAADKSRPEFDEDAQFFSVELRSNSEVIPWDLWGENPPIYPAPTLVEILRALPKERHDGLLTIQAGRIGYHIAAQWIEPPVPLENPQGEYIQELTNAAMRLFLRIAGEEGK